MNLPDTSCLLFLLNFGRPQDDHENLMLDAGDEAKEPTNVRTFMPTR